MSLKINDKIKKELQDKGILLNDGIPVLLTIYFNYKPTYAPPELIRKILSTNIINVDYSTGTYTWNTSLFEGQEENFSWIEEYMELFKVVNKDRKGLRSSVMKNMKKLFMNYPDVRKDEVMKATEEYIKTVDNPQFLISGHKFISNKDGEPLKDYIDELRASKVNKPEYASNPFNKII